MSVFVDRRDLDFLLFDWLCVGAMLERPRYADHSRETLTGALDLCERIARDLFLPHYKKSDVEEPRLCDGRVCVLPEIAAALRACADAGLVGATLPAEHGGAQMPHAVYAACEGMLMAANIASAAYLMLTVGNTRLLCRYGTPAQIDAFAAPQMNGRATGTMCLSEPQAGSSLGDITTRAVPDGAGACGARFRVFGNKMWISGGDHDATETIVHLVLAKVPGSEGMLPAGTAGISLFVVPKHLARADGSVEPNDIAVAGLNHKMGYRGTSNCLLNFGEGAHAPGGAPGAVGYLVGEVGAGLAIMFSMMNEARIAVGLGAAMVAYRGYLLSLEYAKQRVQGRAVGGNAPVPIVAHADVRRMLLAQKAYAEGALALVLYCARLVDEQHSAADAADRERAGRLLGLLTPVAKTWPSEWGLAANDLAIQIHGGYGYTRDFDVEQLYRDNRLNPIHEGTTGIQAIDLVRRKMRGDGGAVFRLLRERVDFTIAKAEGSPFLRPFAAALDETWSGLERIARGLIEEADIARAIVHATPFMRAFGHAVVGWLWLDIVTTAAMREDDFGAGKLAACAYFSDYELPKVAAWLAPIACRSEAVAGMRPERF